MFILPIVGMLLSRYIFNKKHIINEEKYIEIVNELEAKRGE
jgi:Na+/melibiose symporter-like transporter